MKIEEAIEQGLPLEIEIGPGHVRAIGNLLKVGGKWVFADAGWDEPMHSSHQFHILEGEITGEGPWKVGRHIIREADRHWRDEIKKWMKHYRETPTLQQLLLDNIKDSLSLDD